MDPADYCILLAEDNAILRYITSKTLSEQGYCVLEAADGREALRREAEYDGRIYVLVTTWTCPV